MGIRIEKRSSLRHRNLIKNLKKPGKNIEKII